jgi:hypothetical protein
MNKEKENYQKRSLTVQSLVQYIEKFPKIPIAELLCILVSPIGEKTNPFKWNDDILRGKIEKNTEILMEDYKLNWEEEYEG